MSWHPRQLGQQTGRTIVVTGANSGIGFEAVREIVGRGAHVVLAVCDTAKGEKAAARLSGPGSTSIVELDLADVDHVADCANRPFDGHDNFSALICNAGVMGGPLLLSAQGFELQMATNHLGRAALIAALMPLLHTSASRVVLLSSNEASAGSLSPETSREQLLNPTPLSGRTGTISPRAGLEEGLMAQIASSLDQGTVGQPRRLSRVANAGRIASGVVYAGGSLIHFRLATVDAEVYRDFAEWVNPPAWVMEAWDSVFMAHPFVFGSLIGAYELVTGVLILRGGKSAVTGLWLALLFHVGLLFFGLRHLALLCARHLPAGIGLASTGEGRAWVVSQVGLFGGGERPG